MPSNVAHTVESVLRMLEGACNSLAPAFGSSIAGPILAGVGAASGLAADLAALGEDHVAAITRIRSCIPDFDAVTRELDTYARTGKTS